MVPSSNVDIITNMSNLKLTLPPECESSTRHWSAFACFFFFYQRAPTSSALSATLLLLSVSGKLPMRRPPDSIHRLRSASTLPVLSLCWSPLFFLNPRHRCLILMVFFIPYGLWILRKVLHQRKFKVNFPAIWTDGKAEVGRVREEKRRRSKKRKSQKEEDAGAQKGRNVAKHFSNVLSFCGTRGSKSMLAKAAGDHLGRWETNNCILHTTLDYTTTTTATSLCKYNYNYNYITLHHTAPQLQLQLPLQLHYNYNDNDNWTKITATNTLHYNCNYNYN